MDRPPPPLNLVRSFESAARHLSFTVAARELGFTQAAISGHVRSLEQYVGHPLFHRNARSLVLTETGKAYLPTLRDALRQIDSATEAIATARRGEQVVISCPVSLAEGVIISRLAKFLADNRDVRVSVHGAIWDNASESVADLKISFHRDHEAPPDSSLLWRESMVLVCSQSWLDKLEDGLTLAELPPITILGRHDYWALFRQDLDEPIATGKVRHQANSLNIAMEMAAHGLGATVAPSSLARNYLDRQLVVEPVDWRPESPWGCYISRGVGPNPRVASRLMDWMLAEAHS
ncbi:MAG: LysR substrate-binding domain-containing protein [Pseudomonadota bacterium]